MSNFEGQLFPVSAYPSDLLPETTKTVAADLDYLTAVDTSNVEYKITKANLLAGSGGGGSSLQYIQIVDKKAPGVNGGSSTSGSWNTRDLNTLVIDQTGSVTLSSNQFILNSGNYFIRVATCFYRPLELNLRLYNVTDSTPLLYGLNHYVGNLDIILPVEMSGYFTIGSGKSLAIQYRCNQSFASIGLGLATGFNDEIYLTVDIFKL